MAIKMYFDVTIWHHNSIAVDILSVLDCAF